MNANACTLPLPLVCWRQRPRAAAHPHGHHCCQHARQAHAFTAVLHAARRTFVHRLVHAGMDAKHELRAGLPLDEENVDKHKSAACRGRRGCGTAK